MSLRPLKLESVPDVSPGIVATFNSLLAGAIFDCQDRPFDTGKRTVTLTFTLTPAPEDSGTIDKVDVQVAVGSKLPAAKSATVTMGLRGSRQLVFNPESIGDPDQATLLPDPEDR